MMLSGNLQETLLIRMVLSMISFMSILRDKVYCKNYGMIKKLSRSTTKEEVNSVANMLDISHALL